MKEIRGKALADKDYQYHTPLYKALLEQVVPLRTSFRLEKDISAKKQMAKQEFDAWNSYLEHRKQEISELTISTEDDSATPYSEAGHLYSHHIPAGTLQTLKEYFDRFKVSCFSNY